MILTTPNILTLTTDFGTEDFHLPRLKGHLLTAAPTLRLVDINHQVGVYDIVQAAFIFNRVWKSFPAGTIHLLSVNDFYQPKGRFLAFEEAGHFFIGPDNGIFSLIHPRLPGDIYVVDGYLPSASLSSIYATVVAKLAQGEPLTKLGHPAEQIAERLAFQPVMGPNYVRGSVVYVDRFENALTNVTQSLFERVGRGRGFRLILKRNAPIDGLSFRYQDVPEGEPLCRFTSDGLLEIAINLGSAASLLGIRTEDMVQLEFLD